MKKLLLLFASVVLLAGLTSAQVTLSIPEVTPTAENSSVSVSINAEGITDVYAISLKINYDPDVLTFQDAANLADPSFLVTGINGVVSIGWYSLTPLNFGTGKLIDLNFTYNSGSSGLDFIDAECEIAGTSGQILTTTLNNGTVNSAPGEPELPASLGGIVWNDLNKDGIKDNAEPGVQWVTVELYDCNNIWQGWKFTDSTGAYVFDNLTPGDYYVRFYLVDGNSNFEFTVKDAGEDDASDSDVEALDDSTGRTICTTLESGENDLTWYAGISDGVVSPVLNSSIGDLVWNDLNKDGLKDEAEQGLEGITVNLIDSNFDVLSSTVTGTGGSYKFENLAAGTYGVEFVLPEGFSFSPKNVGGDNTIDSDPDALHGRVDPFAVAEGENITSVDAGMYETEVVDPVFVSISDKIFIDENKNGNEDEGEAGLSYVTVELYNCEDVWQAFAMSDSAGNYSFDSVAAGSYYLKFYLVDNNAEYRFTTENIIVINDTTGKTECIPFGLGTVAAATASGTSVGVCKGSTPPPPPAGCPVPFIAKDDGLIAMPDTGKTTTYTITYKNDGDAPLYNAVIVDTLPAGVFFVEASNGGTETDNVVTFNLGTLNEGEGGSVTVKVEVCSHESEYLNRACLTGKSNNVWYTACAEDLNFCDTTSSGGGSGVESRGDMAELLLRREWKIRNGLTTPVLAKTGAGTINSRFTLPELVPVEGPHKSVAVETTPFDILGISNAVSSYAVDYELKLAEGDRRVAGIFSTITLAPNIYDHTKVVCDRLAGSAIEEIKLISVDGYEFYAAKLRKTSGRITDYAISFSVYETPAGFVVENKWTWGEYKAPQGASSVYNFQAWSSSYDGSVQLVRDILTNLQAKGSVTFMNTNQNVPDVFIKSTRYTHDGKVHLTLVNNSENSKSVELTSFLRYSQGDDLIETSTSYTAPAGESEAALDLGIIADAQVELNQNSGFKDEVFVSGGAYTYITGANSRVSEFNTSGYVQQNLSSYPEGTIMLSGGAYAAGQLNDWVTVVRALTTNGSAYDLRSFGQLRFEAKGTGVVTVILDMTNVTNYNYFAKNITLNEMDKEYVLNFRDFKQLFGNEVQFDASAIRAVGFIFNTANNPGSSSFNFEVKNIGFFTEGATSTDNDGSVPDKFELTQNYPNPFNPSTVIEFSVANKEVISLKVFDMLGQEVAQLVNEELAPGKYSFKFDASNLSSGVYFYKLQGQSVNITRKMTLTK